MRTFAYDAKGTRILDLARSALPNPTGGNSFRQIGKHSLAGARWSAEVEIYQGQVSLKNQGAVAVSVTLADLTISADLPTKRRVQLIFVTDNGELPGDGMHEFLLQHFGIAIESAQMTNEQFHALVPDIEELVGSAPKS